MSKTLSSATFYNRTSEVRFYAFDSHREDCIGLAYTQIDAVIEDETDLIDAIHNDAPVAAGGTLTKRKKAVGKLESGTGRAL